MMAKYNFLFSTNTNFIEPSSVWLYSLCRAHSGKELDIYLAYHDLTQKDIETLQNVTKLFKNKKLIPLDVGDEFSQKVKATELFGLETYYRILAVNLLPKDIDRIVYMDADMLVQHDLSEVFEMEMNDDCPFMVCKDIHGLMRGGYQQLLNQAFIPEGYDYFNAGFMIMNLNYLRRAHCVDLIIDMFISSNGKFPYPDQDVLNILYADKVKMLPWSKYNCPPMWWYLDAEDLSNGKIRYASYPEIHNPDIDNATKFIDVTEKIRDNASVIHFLGMLKPWQYRDDFIWEDLKIYAPLWFEMEKEMLAHEQKI